MAESHSAPSRWPSNRHHWVRTPDGVDISVREWGKPDGWPILFVHGVAQSHLSFLPQFASSLADRYRLVAYVDGQENPLSVIDAGKFYEVQKYCAMTNHVWDGYWICANPGSWNRLPNDFKAVVAKAFNEVALLERDDLAKLDRSLQADLEKKGFTFTKPDINTFRDKLRAAGFYTEWRGKIGNDAWVLLEKHVGKLA